MPVIGFLALLRFARRAGRILWQKPEFRGLLGVTAIVIFSGALVFKTLDPQQFTNWTDAIYFTVITLTTVGYGDFSPATPAAKWFAIFYIFLGLGLIGGFIGIISEAFLEDIRQRTEESSEI